MKLAFLAIPLACMGLAGCVDTTGPAPVHTPPPVAQAQVERGTIIAVRQVAVRTGPSDRQTAGTLLGAAAGAILGNQIGEGGGRTAATIVGAGAGAYVGSQIAKDGSGGVAYHNAWTVRLRSGRQVTIVQDTGRLYVGAHVRVVWQGNNSAYIERL